MDSSMISKILMSMRNQPQGSQTPAPAPTGAMPGLDQAYSQSMPPAMQQSRPAPLQFDPMLEQQAQGANNELEPIVQQIMQRLGLMGMIRNRSNQTMLQG